MGLAVIDAGVLIGFLDASDAHHLTAVRALAAEAERGHDLVLASSAYAECLVGPIRRGDVAVRQFHEFLERLPIAVVPLDQPIAAQAAALRARHGNRLRLPDALVIATAIVMDAEALLSTDRGWPRRTALGFQGQLVRV